MLRGLRCVQEGMELCGLAGASGWPHLAREALGTEGARQGRLSWVF